MTPQDILLEAARIIDERGKTYGGVQDSFRRAAALAALMLGREISPRDVTMIMHAVKLARLAESPLHHDSHVDGVNYLAFAAAFAAETASWVDHAQVDFEIAKRFAPESTEVVD